MRRRHDRPPARFWLGDAPNPRSNHAFDKQHGFVYRGKRSPARNTDMGVEGKDKAKVLEAGAAALSGQLGRTVQRLRKSHSLSLSELSTQSGVAKSIISQIERNETNPTLTTIWRLAHALDVSIEAVLQGAEDGPFIEHTLRGGTPILLSDDGLCRLAVIGWLKTVDWLQWYDFQAEPGGVLGSDADPRGSTQCPFVLDGDIVGGVGRVPH